MSLTITRKGLLDSVQDLGRFGYQHLGINPGGAMDRYSAAIANALLGKDLNAPVLELHFPASEISFDETSIICLTGGDFTPGINGQTIPRWQPVLVQKGDLLQFRRHTSGARVYLSCWPGMNIDPWLGSCSTNLKAAAGGMERPLKNGDVITLRSNPLTNKMKNRLLPWKAPLVLETGSKIDFIPGPEWNWMDKNSQTLFLNNDFLISKTSDRMGYRLKGRPLSSEKTSMVSSATGFGTVQLLPDGQLIILMADHQTTGGYPRVAQVTSTAVSLLAQKQPGESIVFTLTSLELAQEKLINREKFLLQLKNTCNFKLEKFLHDSV